jgi:hypothetical protein
MDSDIAMNMLTARAAMTQHSVQIAVVKKAHEMQTDLINQLMQTALAPPPPGQGARVDRLA